MSPAFVHKMFWGYCNMRNGSFSLAARITRAQSITFSLSHGGRFTASKRSGSSLQDREPGRSLRAYVRMADSNYNKRNSVARKSRTASRRRRKSTKPEWQLKAQIAALPTECAPISIANALPTYTYRYSN